MSKFLPESFQWDMQQEQLYNCYIIISIVSIEIFSVSSYKCIICARAITQLKRDKTAQQP
ncbi:hypothetical protein CI610_03667 [invertebrate metagenome]|uniref:Uncharacterized protein n=1 Tax=invertebrate metagenome TaxID=1711999 RepID=A0A2H9T2G2_9ZZZZ